MKTPTERLRHAWQQSGKTQTQIAEDCKVSREAVSQWVAEEPENSTNPSYTNLVAFAESTGYRLNWLLTGEGPEKKNSPEESGPDRTKELDLENLLKAVDIVEKFLPSSRYKLRIDDRAEIIDHVRKQLSNGLPRTAEILKLVTPLREQYGKRWRDTDDGRTRRGHKGSNKRRPSSS